MKPKVYIAILASAALAIGVLGAILLTEIGQILDLPRSWVFGFHRFKHEISLALAAAAAIVLLLNYRRRVVSKSVAGSFAAIMLACLFFINVFAPYIWLRAQHHSAVFVSIESVEPLLRENDDVMVLEINGDARAYPKEWIMVPHIAGDSVGGEEVVMTYCALSDLPQAFANAPYGRKANFKVIAQVNNNLIFTDTESGELYQQITGKGGYSGSEPESYPVQRMPWHAFRKLYPLGKVFLPQPNLFDRMTIWLFNTTLVDHYGGEPMFPTLSMDDQRLPPGEPVWGLREGGEALAIPQSHFGETDSLEQVILNGRPVVIAWFADYRTMGAFYADRDQQALTISEIDPYGNSNAGKLTRVHLYPGVLWMVWSHWFPETQVWPKT